jgi:hypothetical protein
MSFLERLNPLRMVRNADTVPRLQELGEKMREDQKAMARQLRTIARQLEQIEERLARQDKSLASLPQLHAQIQRCVTAYTKDARQAGRMPSVRARLGDGEAVAAHVSSAVARAVLELEPFPHAVIENLLPEDVCDELIAALPPSAFFTTEKMSRQELEVPFEFAPEYSRLVWGVFFEKAITEAMVPALTEKFRPALDDFVRAHWPGLGSLSQAGIALQVSNSRLMLRRPGYVIKPHRDPRWAFLTCLVYLPKSPEHQIYGTQLYRLRQEPELTHNSPLWADPDECDLVKDVPARRNTALVFLNSTGAHGASIPREAPADTARFLYQVQFGVDERMREKLVHSLDEEKRASWATDRGAAYP